MTDTWDELIDEVIAEYRHGCNNARSALRAAIDAAERQCAILTEDKWNMKSEIEVYQARVAALEAQLAEAREDAERLANAPLWYSHDDLFCPFCHKEYEGDPSKMEHEPDCPWVLYWDRKGNTIVKESDDNQA